MAWPWHSRSTVQHKLYFIHQVARTLFIEAQWQVGLVQRESSFVFHVVKGPRTTRICMQISYATSNTWSDDLVERILILILHLPRKYVQYHIRHVRHVDRAI